MKKILLVLLTVLLAFTCTGVVSFAADDATNDEAIILSSIEDINKYLTEEIYELEGEDTITLSSVSVVPGETAKLVLTGKSSAQENKEWHAEYAITDEEYLKLFAINNSVLVYQTDVTTLTQDQIKLIGDAIISANPDLGGGSLDFDLMRFVYNLKWMGLGMLGIFVVIGVVIILTYILNKVTGKKSK